MPRLDDGEVRARDWTERGQEVALDAGVLTDGKRTWELPAFEDGATVSAEKGRHPERIAGGRPSEVVAGRQACEGDGAAALQEQNEEGEDGKHRDGSNCTCRVSVVGVPWARVCCRSRSEQGLALQLIVLVD